MNTWMRAFVFLAIFAFAVHTPTVWATDYTFTPQNGTDGDWNDPNNWSPSGGPPGVSDKATIPNGKTCKVTIPSQEVRTLVVDAGGFLGLESGQLTIGLSNGSSTSTVNGTLYFKKPSSGSPVLRIDGQVTINGSGTITARHDSGYDPGQIYEEVADPMPDPPSTLAFGADLNAIGSIAFNIRLTNSGTLTVDDADDTMRFGDDSGTFSASILDGPSTGTVNVSGGMLRFNTCALKGSNAWNLSGGEIKVTVNINIPSPSTYATRVSIYGGTLRLEDDFTTHGGITFAAGTIRVAQGKSAAFLQ